MQVKTYIPKVPKHSLVPHHLNTITDNPPSSLMPEPDHSTENTSHEALFSSEGPEGPSLTHRAFVPMPPICSDSTLHSETVSQQSRTAGLMSPDHPSDEDAKSTESIFLTQVTAPSCPSRSRSAHRFLQPLSTALLRTPQGRQETPRKCSSQAPPVLCIDSISDLTGTWCWPVCRGLSLLVPLSLSAERYLTSHASLGPGNKDGSSTGATFEVLMV